MWANAKRDGRPAKYRWHPLFNAAKFGWLPTTTAPCSNTAKMRNPLKFVGVPQTLEPISAVSGPNFAILRGHVEQYCCLTRFFPTVNTCLSYKDTARQSCALGTRWRFFASFLHPVFPASRVQHVSDLHHKFTMCGSMADVHSATAEIRRGKKER